MTPLDANYLARAPFTFVMDRELGVPRAEAFRLLSDPDVWPRWFPDMKRMRWISPEGERGKVGAIRRADTGSGDVIEHFVAWDENVRLAFYAERMSTPLVSEFFEDYVLSDVPGKEGRCMLRWTVGYRPRTLIRPFHPLIRPRFRKMFEDGADAFARYCQS